MNIIDVAPLGFATQSSFSEFSKSSGAQALVQDEPGDFAIHTNEENGPWWQLELPWPVPIQKILIENRSDQRYRERARRLCVEVSQDGMDWVTVHSGYNYFGDGLKGQPLSVDLGRKITARHIRLSLPEKQTLHLRGIKIFAHPDDVQMRQIWRQYGFDFEKQDSLVSGPPYPYRLIQEDRAKTVVGLKVRTGGRLGNAIIQLIQSIYLAERLKLAVVIAPAVRIGSRNNQIEVGNLRLVPSEDPAPAGRYLCGDFFYPNRLGRTVFEGLSEVARRRIALEYLVPFFGLGRLPNEALSSPRELAIHIRSGDVFSDSPPAAYVQPPAAFYRQVIDRFMSQGAIDKVCIVSEDRRNPCIGAIEAYLMSRGIPSSMQSGSLLEDVEYLRSAKNVVYGFGTFGYGVSLIAGEIETLQYFSDAPQPYRRLPNVRLVTRFGAKEGAYIRPGEWKRTEAQLKQMLDFPVESLVIYD